MSTMTEETTELLALAEEIMPSVTNKGDKLALQRVMKGARDSGANSPLEACLDKLSRKYGEGEEDELPDLPDTFTLPPQTVSVKTLPGYRSTTVPDNAYGKDLIKQHGLTKAKNDCPFVPPEERELWKGDDGYLHIGTDFVCIEKESHYQGRHELTEVNPAKDQSKRLGLLNERKPGDPSPFATTTEKGQAPLIKT